VNLGSPASTAKSRLELLHRLRVNVASGDIIMGYQGNFTSCDNDWTAGTLTCQQTTGGDYNTCYTTYSYCKGYTGCCVEAETDEDGKSTCVQWGSCCIGYETGKSYYCCGQYTVPGRTDFRSYNARCNAYYGQNTYGGGWWQKPSKDTQTNYVPYNPTKSTSSYTVSFGPSEIKMPNFGTLPTATALTYLNQAADNYLELSKSPDLQISKFAPGYNQTDLNATASTSGATIVMKDYSVRGTAVGTSIPRNWGDGANGAWDNSLGGPFISYPVAGYAAITCIGVSCAITPTGNTMTVTYNLPGDYHDFGYLPIVYFTAQFKNVESYDNDIPGVFILELRLLGRRKRALWVI
jgi:hypothetical protein